MKKLTLLILLVITSNSFRSLAFSSTPACRKTQDERKVSNFKGVAAGGPINVKITLGNTESIRFEGDREAIAELISEVENGVLTIRPKTRWNEWSRRFTRPEITVFITAKRLTSLTMTGSGNMEVINAITGSTLAVTLSGSGNIQGTTTVDSFAGEISGSGNITFSGKATDATLTLSGSGSFRGKTLATENAVVQISGSADVSIRASAKLEAVISGSGDIHYSGNAVVKKTIIGSGSVSRL